MSNFSYYHCQHCREEVGVEIECPCCGLGRTQSHIIKDFLKWLKVHIAGLSYRNQIKHHEYISGYKAACENIELELNRVKDEEADEGLKRDKGLLV
jgi:hypothetical protein